MQSVFNSYAVAGKDNKGLDTDSQILTKDKARDASMDIIMKWNDLPE